jgi:predicted GNAT superfamily acetyltransferase
VPFRFRDLTTFAEFQQVERLEAEVWGPIDLVPVPIMAVTVKRGAVLIGAYDGDRLAGFVYSFPALRREDATTHPHNHEGAKARRHEETSLVHPSHWSHTLGVHPDYRGAGLGRDLKLAQRERVLALGLIDLLFCVFFVCAYIATNPGGARDIGSPDKRATRVPSRAGPR